MRFLSKRQEEALRLLAKSDKWESAYSLQASLRTLDALYDRGYVERQYELGSYAFPRNSIKYRVTEAGRQALG